MSVKELNRLCQEEKLSSVCEVGCGLGDIIRHVRVYDNIFKRVYVKYILLDIVDGEGYPYKHDWKYLLPNFGVYKVVGKWGLVWYIF